tara:strand:+ start:10042 stop:10494 length:453 start_codon:yes stop_codon:yes gene_type:complete
MKEVKIPNRMTGTGQKFLIRGTNGGGYKTHAMIYWPLKDINKNGLPNIRKLKISARPLRGATAPYDFVNTLIEESLIGFNRNLKKGGDFEDECNALGKSGFVGVVANYVKENLWNIMNEKPTGKIIELQLDSKNRLSMNYKDKLINGEII